MVEDEEMALTKEYMSGLSSHQVKSEDQAVPSRGSIDQYPIILDNKETLSPSRARKVTASSGAQTTAYVRSGKSGANPERRGYDADMDDDSSDDSMVYIRKETNERSSSLDRKRDLAAGVLAGVGAAELLRNRKRREDQKVSHEIRDGRTKAKPRSPPYQGEAVVAHSSGNRKPISYHARDSINRYTDNDASQGREADRMKMPPPPQPHQPGDTSTPRPRYQRAAVLMPESGLMAYGQQPMLTKPSRIPGDQIEYGMKENPDVIRGKTPDGNITKSLHNREGTQHEGTPLAASGRQYSFENSHRWGEPVGASSGAEAGGEVYHFKEPATTNDGQPDIADPARRQSEASRIGYDDLNPVAESLADDRKARWEYHRQLVPCGRFPVPF
jgi:hypothetical protein